MGNPIVITKPQDNGGQTHIELRWEARKLVYLVAWEDYEINGDGYVSGNCIKELSFTYDANGYRVALGSIDDMLTTVVDESGRILEEEWYLNSYGTFNLVYIYDELGTPIGIKCCGVNRHYFFEKNLQGDIVAIYNETGIKIGTYTYDAWGNFVVGYTDGIDELDYLMVGQNPFRYRGYYYDYFTGLYYLQSRYYNPVTGRFLNADKFMSDVGGDLRGSNIFVYCLNNPITYIDESGEFAVLPAIVAAVMMVTIHVVAPDANHKQNAINEQQIVQEIEETYTRDQAEEEINRILSEYGEDCTIILEDDYAHIVNSYLVTSKYDRQKICMILSRAGVTDRPYDDLSAEWFAHNVSYYVEYDVKSARHVDLDYRPEDNAPMVQAVTNLCRIWGFE